MIAIASADRKWGIGNKNSLLVRIPEDMKFFRANTMGKVIVMGRKTLESFPNGMPLKGRTNIILSRKKDFMVKDGIVVHSEEELFQELKGYDPGEIYVIGGESIYRMLLPYCSQALITKIDYSYEADAFFPNLDREPGWEREKEGEENTYFSIEYRYITYRNTNVCPIPE